MLKYQSVVIQNAIHQNLTKQEIDNLNKQLKELQQKSKGIKNQASTVVDNGMNLTGQTSNNIMTIMNIKNNVYKNVCNELI